MKHLWSSYELERSSSYLTVAPLKWRDAAYIIA